MEPHSQQEQKGSEVQDTEGFARVAQQPGLVLEVIAALCPKKEQGIAKKARKA